MENAIDVAKKIAELIYPLSDESLERFASILVRRKLNKGDKFLDSGEICDQLGYVYSGLIRQFYFKNKRELTEHFAIEGDIFICIESFLCQRPANLLAEALEDSVVYGIPHDPLLELSAVDYEIEVLYRKILEDSLILSQRKADSFRFENSRQRYERLMQENPTIVQRAPLNHVASYLLMTPETLSRVRAMHLNSVFKSRRER